MRSIDHLKTAATLCAIIALSAWGASAVFADRGRVMRFHDIAVADIGWDAGDILGNDQGYDAGYDVGYDAGYDVGLGDGGYDVGVASTKSTEFAATSDDYVSFSDRDGINAGSTKWSINCWVYGRTLVSGMTIASQWGGSGSTCGFHFALTSASGIQTILYVSTGSGTCASNYWGRTTDGSLSTSTWYMVTATFDASLGGLAIDMYVNAVAKSRAFGGSAPSAMSNVAYDMSLGNYPPSLNGVYAWDGYIDDCTIYDGTALTSGQITTLYGAGKPSFPISPSPTWHDRMGENPGTNPNQSDEAGGATGTCTNMASNPCINTTTVP
jgi:hypothetical protein